MRIELDTTEKIVYVKSNEPVKISELSSFIMTSFQAEYDEYRIALRGDQTENQVIQQSLAGSNGSSFSFKPSAPRGNGRVEVFKPDSGPDYDKMKVEE